MVRSIISETATNIVKTVAIDHVGVKPNGRNSWSFSSIVKYPNQKPNLKYDLRTQNPSDKASMNLNYESH